MTDTEIDAKLDEICENVRGASLLNALHACRPGHPLGDATEFPFFNAYCALRAYSGFVEWNHLAWLERQAEDRGEVKRFKDRLAATTFAKQPASLK